MPALLAILALWFLPASGADSAAAAAAVRAAIEQQVRASGEEAMVEGIRMPRLPLLPEGGSYRVAGLPAGPVRGAVTLMLEGAGDGGPAARIPVSCHVRTYGKALTAVRQLDRHVPVGPGDVAVRTVETTRLPAGRLTEAGQLEGKRTTRIISEGSVLFSSLCESLPAVRQGETVTLVVRSRGVRLTVPAVAKQDGLAGATILVQPAGAHERVRSRVIDGRTVEVLAD